MSAGDEPTRQTADVAVIGGGPAGLTAAAELGRAGAGRVVVVDREPAMGGIPRHAQHQGFGLRDLRRVMSGPRYGAHLAARAAAAGAVFRTETQVTGWTAGGELELSGPDGRSALAARAVVLATGCRERPRAARLVPGSRPQGVMTTGMLQQLVYLQGQRPGRRAVIVGAEHVSFSALLTLAHGGAKAVAMVTDLPRHQTFGIVRAGAALRFRTPLLTSTAVGAIRGRSRVDAVELLRTDTGAVLTLPCDLVVFTADWIPDHELAVSAGAALDPATRGPAVDPGLHTSLPGLFAAGNAIHGAEPADVAALTGRHVAAGVLRHLRGEAWPSAGVPITCRPPLGWIVPNVVAPSATGEVPPRGRFLLRSREVVRAEGIELAQDGRTLWRGRGGRLVPGRSMRIPWTWTSRVDPGGGPVVARIR